jgi:anaerobic magnesium-protoporphyrin IX monomethyl ester cyclase
MPGKSAAVDALFVGYENQENLGVRYVMASLEARGYRTALAPYHPANPGTVLEMAAALRSPLIGFSVIFQYTIAEFGDVMRRLRERGVTAHFTAGGHYPSLRPEATLAALPDLDSVVRFEGELIAPELLSLVDHPAAWSDIAGLAFRRDGRIIVNPPRALVPRLDDLPWPKRSALAQTVRGIPAAPILASRGCCFDCSFCSIREFYGGAPGLLRRARSPEDVVCEMQDLHDRRGVRLFLFQDDDFAMKTAEQRRWLERFLAAIDRRRLGRDIGWKISCRVDDVDAGLLGACRDRGLLVVYLGIESGSADGLATLNKRASVHQNLDAMRTVKDLGLEFDMGFMLFDPDSTFGRVRENLAFLRQVASLGGPPIAFVKMLPLAGTAIERRLNAEGRLTGTEIRPDYDLLDARLDHYALFVTLNFSARNSDPSGLIERLRLAHFDCLVAQRFERAPFANAYGGALRDLIDDANISALDTLERSLDLVEALPPGPDSVPLAWPRLGAISAAEAREQTRILEELDLVLARYSPGLRQALRDDAGAALHEEAV